eukprot:PLAT3920.1.p1 GENE.PLAT3920.1~~PLAT3920.1.p1  ORF type:complete len:183 (+),score=9.25 PLAT3920.1:218-766(+)
MTSSMDGERERRQQAASTAVTPRARERSCQQLLDSRSHALHADPRRRLKDGAIAGNQVAAVRVGAVRAPHRIAAGRRVVWRQVIQQQRLIGQLRQNVLGIGHALAVCLRLCKVAVAELPTGAAVGRHIRRAERVCLDIIDDEEVHMLCISSGQLVGRRNVALKHRSRVRPHLQHDRLRFQQL